MITVGCTLSDPATLGRVTDAVRAEGGQVVPLTRGELRQATARPNIAALVYDLEPGDAPAANLVRRIHAARPDWPMWLYYTPRIPVIQQVAEVASLHGVWTSPQAAGPQLEAEVRIHVRRLLTSVPRVRLLGVLEDVLRPLPPDVRAFFEINLERRDGHESEDTETLTATAGSRSELRYLERLCQAAVLPGPKRLLDHLTLVLVTFKTVAYRVPLVQAARQSGLSPKAFDELRHNLLGADASAASLEPRAQFEFAIAALANACHAPLRIAEDLVQQILRDRIA